jgi:sarcosine dehydrogenase
MNESISEIQRLLQEIADHLKSGTQTDTRKAVRQVGTDRRAGGDMPFSFGCELFADEMERLEPILEAAMQRVPLIGEMGLQRVVNGPIPFTPDGEPILGPSPDLDNVWLGIGFSSGVAASGGAGRALAHWIVEGAPEFALPSLDPSRFGTAAIPLDVLNARAITAYASYYALAQPIPG